MSADFGYKGIASLVDDLPVPARLNKCDTFCGTVRIPVDSFQETSGGSRMVIRISNLYDSSTSTTNQRQRNEVYQTPRFRAPDAYPYRHARVAASRCLRQNDGNRKSLSNIQDLP